MARSLLTNIVLASGSPRRSFLLKEIGTEHSILKVDFEENIPNHVAPKEVAIYLSQSKARQIPHLEDNTIYITSDTIVLHDSNILGKPKNRSVAIETLLALSNSIHQVITGVTLTSLNKSVSFDCVSTVHFKKLSLEEIEYYIDNFNPYDKAGSYGIQEWIGLIGVTKIEGSYFNIMGLPTHELKIQLDNFIS